MSQKKFYQVGGALDYNAPSYVERDADKELYDYIKEGEYCYVLKYRQVGKSSLRVHCSNKLESEGFKCINIDLTSLGTDIKTSDEWYYSFLYDIVDELELSEEDFNVYWDKYKKLTVTSRSEWIIDKFILKECNEEIVIFIDEIDSVLGIKNFSTDDFFALIRRFHILRAEDSRYNRLVFVLLGVASSKDLMEDKTRTPFNIAKDIKMGQLALEGSYKLTNGLNKQVIDKKEILKKVFEYTSGTSYLTQKILDYIAKNPISKVDDINDIVNNLFIEQSFNEINIETVQGRILTNKTHNAKMLYLLAQILDGQKIKNITSRRTIIYLKLSGLIKENNGFLEYSNKIYKEVFNRSWLNDMIEKIDRPIATDLQKWLVHKQQSNYLLKGDVLENINNWADSRDDLSELEHKFLRLSIKEEEKKKSKKLKIEKRKAEEKLEIEKEKVENERKKIEIEKKKAEEKLFKTRKKANYKLSMLLFVLLVFVVMFGKYYYESKEKALVLVTNKEEMQNQINLKLKKLLLDVNPAIKSYQDYNIPNNIEDIEVLIKKSIRMSDYDKNIWLAYVEYMSKESKNRLFKILKYYAYMDKGDEYNQKIEYQKAIKFYESAMQYSSDMIYPYIEIGKIYYQVEEYTKSIETYNKINHKTNQVYFLMGDTYVKLKKYEKAIESYNEILKNNPKNEEALSRKGKVYFEIKDYERVIESYTNAITINPKNDESYMMLAYTCDIQGKYQKAIEAYDMAININPNNKKAIYSKNLSYEKLEKEDSRNIKNYYNIGISFYKGGREKKALEYFKKAINIDSNSSEIYYAMGLSYDKLEQYDKVIESCTKSIDINASNVKSYELMGNAYYKLEEYKTAIINYKKSIKINPKNNNINMNLHNAFINIFHAELIAFNEIKNKVYEAEYIDLFQKKKEYFGYYEALKILEKIYRKEQVDINNWLDTYVNISLDNRDIEYIRRKWIEMKLKNNPIRFKLDKILNIFKNRIPELEYLSFSEAIKDAKNEQKIVMVFVYEIGCKWCNILEKNLEKNEMKKILYKNFKAVKVDKQHIPLSKVVHNVPTLLFYRPQTKQLLREISSIDNLIDDLDNTIKEEIVLYKKKGYLRQAIKDEGRRKFTKDGWVYLGEYKDGRWKSKKFEFTENLNPSNLKGSYQTAKSRQNIRVKLKGRIISGLKKGDDVKIVDVDVNKKFYIWAKVKY